MSRTAVNQGPGCGDDYPFTVEHAARHLVLDFYLSYEDSGCGAPRPFRLYTASGFDLDDSESDSTSHTRDVKILDANGDTVVDTDAGGVTFLEKAWGDDRYVTQWIGPDFVIRMVWSAAGAAGVTDLETFDAPLDSVTCHRMPRRLKSVTVGDDTLVGDIELVNGYNTTLVVAATSSTDGGRVRTMLTISATPGSGIGVYPGCTEDAVPFSRINGVSPAEGGNFTLSTTDCHRLRLPGAVLDTQFVIEAEGLTEEEAAAAWQLVNDCETCRRCEDFEAVGTAARRVFDGFWTVGQTAQAVAQTYSTNRDRWLAQKECRQSRAAKLAVYPGAECKTAVSATFCNTTGCCLYPVELRFTFIRYTDGSPAAAGTGGAYEAYVDATSGNGEEVYAIEGAWPVFRVFVPSVDPQGSVAVRFRTCGTCGDTDTFEVTMTVHADDPGVDGNGDPCGLPVAEVPVEVENEWTTAGIVETLAVTAITSQTVPVSAASTTFDCGCE